MNINDGVCKNALINKMIQFFLISSLEFDYDDTVGSLDEGECISPTDAHQWIYDRARGQASLDNFFAKNDDIQEEDEEDPAKDRDRRDSENFQMPDLNDLEKSKLLSCIDEIRNIIGETYSDRKLTEVIIANNYDFNKALDTLLKGDSSREKPLPAQHSKITDTVEKGNTKIYFSSSSNFFLSLPFHAIFIINSIAR